MSKEFTLGELKRKDNQLKNKLKKVYELYAKKEDELQNKAYVYQSLNADINELQKEYEVLTEKFVKECEIISNQIEEIEKQINKIIKVNIQLMK